jgi:phenylalanine-4-hydroxylase
MWMRNLGSGPAGDVRNLVQLGSEHPGFHDPEYRARRDEIARIALHHSTGDLVPDAPYTSAEHQVWAHIGELLAPVHERRVCHELLEASRRFPLERQQIPQLRSVNARLQAATGFRMEPVMGLVHAHTFLSHLGRRVFLSTQYVRHHSRPLYTPEPDIVHELIGHAASLAHPRVAQVNACMGWAADVADSDEVLRLERVYWYTLEFGLVEEAGGVKAFGAGLLSSAGELDQIEDGPRLEGWDLAAIAETPYDPTDMQPQLFVAPSFDRLLHDVQVWVESGGWMLRPRTVALSAG